MENKIETSYSNTLNIKMNEWLLNEGNNFIYIYGGIDPWGACAVNLENSKTNSINFTAPNGSHSTRISTFDKFIENQIMDSLEVWLKFEF